MVGCEPLHFAERGAVQGLETPPLWGSQLSGNLERREVGQGAPYAVQLRLELYGSGRQRRAGVVVAPQMLERGAQHLLPIGRARSAPRRDDHQRLPSAKSVLADAVEQLVLLVVR